MTFTQMSPLKHRSLWLSSFSQDSKTLKIYISFTSHPAKSKLLEVNQKHRFYREIECYILLQLINYYINSLGILSRQIICMFNFSILWNFCLISPHFMFSIYVVFLFEICCHCICMSDIAFHNQSILSYNGSVIPLSSFSLSLSWIRSLM